MQMSTWYSDYFYDITSIHRKHWYLYRVDQITGHQCISSYAVQCIHPMDGDVASLLFPVSNHAEIAIIILHQYKQCRKFINDSKVITECSNSHNFVFRSKCNLYLSILLTYQKVVLFSNVI